MKRLSLIPDDSPDRICLDNFRERGYQSTTQQYSAPELYDLLCAYQDEANTLYAENARLSQINANLCMQLTSYKLFGK